MLFGLWYAAIAASVPIAVRSQPAPDGNVETVIVQLSSFAFRPDHLHFRVGTPVRLQLVNESSGGHDFSAPAFFAASAFPTGSAPSGGVVEVAGGHTAEITLIPRVPGTFKVECTHFLHSLFGMTATIVVDGPSR